jgi:hypothetical protein
VQFAVKRWTRDERKEEEEEKVMVRKYDISDSKQLEEERDERTLVRAMVKKSLVCLIAFELERELFCGWLLEAIVRTGNRHSTSSNWHARMPQNVGAPAFEDGRRTFQNAGLRGLA